MPAVRAVTLRERAERMADEYALETGSYTLRDELVDYFERHLFVVAQIARMEALEMAARECEAVAEDVVKWTTIGSYAAREAGRRIHALVAQPQEETDG